MQLTSRLQSRGITRKPDGSRGTSSDTAASTGAKTSWAHAPTAFSSTPLQSYFTIQPPTKQIQRYSKILPQRHNIYIQINKQYVLANTLHIIELSLESLNNSCFGREFPLTLDNLWCLSGTIIQFWWNEGEVFDFGQETAILKWTPCQLSNLSNLNCDLHTCVDFSVTVHFLCLNQWQDQCTIH